MTTIIQADKLSKLYRIQANSTVGWWRNRGVLADDIARYANLLRGKRMGERKVNFWALRDVSFEAGPGDVVGIIGRNGAGKSTLLKILGRVTEPTSGRAVVMGRVGSLLEVGTGFHSELTGRENIFISGAILGMTRAEVRKKFDEIVAFSGVEEFLDTPVKRFSSGMEVRLAFSVAVHLQPKVLLVDEVLSVGDSSFREKSLGKIREISNSGATILIVSHNMTALASMCNKALVLEHGQVTFPAGDVASAIEHYLSTARDGVRNNLKAGRRGAKPVGIEITDFQVKDLTGGMIENFTGGDDVNLMIEFEDRGMPAKSNIEFEILVKTLNGDAITLLESGMQVKVLPKAGSKNRISCRIKKLPLVSGTVSLTITALQGVRVLDRIEDVFIGHVVMGSHMVGHPHVGARAWMAMDHAWTIEE